MKSAAVRTKTKPASNRINTDIGNIAKHLNVKSSNLIFRKASGSHDRGQAAQIKRSIEIPRPNDQSSEGTGATPDHSPLRTRLSNVEPS